MISAILRPVIRCSLAFTAVAVVAATAAMARPGVGPVRAGVMAPRPARTGRAAAITPALSVRVALPDLQIGNFLDFGGMTSFDIRNPGPGEISAAMYRLLANSLILRVVTGHEVKNYTLAQLDPQRRLRRPGGFLPVHFVFSVVPASPGTIRIEIDPDHYIAEANEHNNVFTGAYSSRKVARPVAIAPPSGRVNKVPGGRMAGQLTPGARNAVEAVRHGFNADILKMEDLRVIGLDRNGPSAPTELARPHKIRVTIRNTSAEMVRRQGILRFRLHRRGAGRNVILPLQVPVTINLAPHASMEAFAPFVAADIPDLGFAPAPIDINYALTALHRLFQGGQAQTSSNLYAGGQAQVTATASGNAVRQAGAELHAGTIKWFTAPAVFMAVGPRPVIESVQPMLVPKNISGPVVLRGRGFGRKQEGKKLVLVSVADENGPRLPANIINWSDTNIAFTPPAGLAGPCYIFFKDGAAAETMSASVDERSRIVVGVKQKLVRIDLNAFLDGTQLRQAASDQEMEFYLGPKEGNQEWRVTRLGLPGQYTVSMPYPAPYNGDYFTGKLFGGQQVRLIFAPIQQISPVLSSYKLYLGDEKYIYDSFSFKDKHLVITTRYAGNIEEELVRNVQWQGPHRVCFISSRDMQLSIPLTGRSSSFFSGDLKIFTGAAEVDIKNSKITCTFPWVPFAEQHQCAAAVPNHQQCEVRNAVDMTALLQHGTDNVLAGITARIAEAFGQTAYRTTIAHELDRRIRDKIGNNAGIVDFSTAGPDTLLVSYY